MCHRHERAFHALLRRFLFEPGPALAALALAGAAGAQVSPAGPEFQVNTYTTSFQSRPAVATDAAGNFVVVWQSDGSNEPDTDGFSVLAQRYDASGAPQGIEFQVNSYTTAYQTLPVIAADAAGNFVVVWVSDGSSGTDTSLNSIQSQRFDASGVPQGGQIQVNTYSTLEQTLPAIAADAAGNFVIAWASNGSGGTDSDLISVQAQRFDAGGAPQGGEIQVNTYTVNQQSYPAIAMNSEGGFVVAWHSFGSSGTDTDGYSVQAQRFDAGGVPQGGQFQVNTYTTNHQAIPAVAADAAGNFVVAWTSNGSDGTDTSSYSIQAQRFDADGVPQGGQFQVNTYAPSAQIVPAITADAAGHFVVAWSSDGSSGTDTSQFSAQAQRFDATGVPLGDEFQVNTYTTNGQADPAVATDATGDFVVAWTSVGSSGTDTSSFSVQAQRYDGVFRDGFDSGDTTRWSAAVP